MKQLTEACVNILNQLQDVVRQMDEGDFVKPSSVLSHSTVGQHLRHTLEFFFCLQAGSKSGRVNYDKRSHDKIIETDKILALHAIERIKAFVTVQSTDQPLLLEVGYARHDDTCFTMNTNFFRELTYNIEHAVHHMAIMKIGIRDVAPYVQLPYDFGIAVSTLRHKEAVSA
jgi:uncharacterized damage-inducible protein DinB